MGSLLPARDTDKFNIPVPEDNWAKMVTKRFVFNGDTISTLKSKAIGQISADKLHPSRVEVVTVLIWKGKTAQKIPDNSFRNAFKLALARFKTTESKLDFDDLVSLLANAITSIATDYSNTEDVDGFLIMEIDFGWEKPSWESNVHKPSDIFLMMDMKFGRGIETWETLEKETLKFQQDDDIVAFSSKSDQPCS